MQSALFFHTLLNITKKHLQKDNNMLKYFHAKYKYLCIGKLSSAVFRYADVDCHKSRNGENYHGRQHEKERERASD